jgi:hypothetical protein
MKTIWFVICALVSTVVMCSSRSECKEFLENMKDKETLT